MDSSLQEKIIGTLVPSVFETTSSASSEQFGRSEAWLDEASFPLLGQKCSDLKANLLRIQSFSHYIPHPSADDPVTQIRLVVEQGRPLCELYNMLSIYDFHDPICLEIFDTLSPHHAARRSISRFRARLKMMHEAGVIEENAVIDESDVLNPVSAHAFQRVLDTMAIILEMLPASVFGHPPFADISEPPATSDGDHMKDTQAKLAESEPREANRRETIHREPNESAREPLKPIEQLKRFIIDWRARAIMNPTIEDRKLLEDEYQERNEQALIRLRELVVDWNGHAVSTFGELILEDIFTLTRPQARTRLHVYLFERLLLFCRMSDSDDSAQIKGRIFTNFITHASTTHRGAEEPSLSQQYPLSIWWEHQSNVDYLTLWCTTKEQRSLWDATVERLADIAADRVRSEVYAQLSWFAQQSSGNEIVGSSVPPTLEVSLFPSALAPPSATATSNVDVPLFPETTPPFSDSSSMSSSEKRLPLARHLPRRVQIMTIDED